MLFEIISTIITLFFLISLFVITNLLRKLEAYEDAVELQTSLLTKINNTILESNRSIQELDAKGSFQSDDEVGFFFEGLKNIQSELNRYTLEVENAEKKEKQSILAERS